jgi:two-component system alkaline phosphatase synthesis response regulator PhoP
MIMEVITVAKRILLAEDDRFMRRACEVALRRRGFDVLLAEDGEQALRLTRAELPDLLLLDLLMPKMSGIDVLREVKNDSATRAIPVVILSNSSRELEISDARALGAVGYLIKANLSLQELGNEIVQLIGASDDQTARANIACGG